MSQEKKRLEEQHTTPNPIPIWQKWGPYVSERSWGTVREDYSWDGNAWNFFPFEQAAAKVYRWGEDGIAGWCDRYQILSFAPAFWNGKDPILKERLFGVNSMEGNHGEDVKEYYFYLDGVPTHSYMKYLYKYPQAEYPYKQLVDESRSRKCQDREYELVDTGIFENNRYFDIYIEYAKIDPEDLAIKIEAFNRGPDGAPLHIIPHLWFRNTWAWGDVRLSEPTIVEKKSSQFLCLEADDSLCTPPKDLMFDYYLGKYYLYGPSEGGTLFTNNEDKNHAEKFLKDAFHRHIIYNEDTLNPSHRGTKACFHYFSTIPSKESSTIYLRLSNKTLDNPLTDIEQVFIQRKKEADDFYEELHHKNATAEEKLIQRQAIAGLLWNKQIYLFDVSLWLQGDNSFNLPPSNRHNSRNRHWRHLNSMRIMLMPDKWEYPWFASWDLALQCLTLGLVDIECAKQMLWFILFDQFQHPNGQIPAFEWDFSDLNPPLQGFAAWQLYCMQREQSGKEDRVFLKKCLIKLLMNFSWWVNKVDSAGFNVFEGGFLGLDNIAIVNRSEKLPGGVFIQQSDGTGWMGMYCLNLMRIALEIAKDDVSYEAIATKFFQHFVVIAYAMKVRDNKYYELWSEKDGFFYDVLCYPDHTYRQFSIRSLVGIIPIYAVEVLTQKEIDQYSEFKRDFEWYISKRSNFMKMCMTTVTDKGETKYVLSLVNGDHLEKVLKYAWNSAEFKSDYGLRSLSKYHQDNPFSFRDWQMGYEPGESLGLVKGGNSNWRGPIWMPTTYLFIKALKVYASVFKDVVIETPGEEPTTIGKMAESFAQRLISIFMQNREGVRPFWGNDFPYASDPYWKDPPFVL